MKKSSGSLSEGWSVLHLSTGHEGGAGIAARRLNSALNRAGVNSKFIALKNKNYTPRKNEYCIRRNLREKLLGKFTTFLQNCFSSEVLFTLFSTELLSSGRVQKFGGPDKTILHIHNWFNLTSQKQLIKLGKKGYAIVITLHDERFFTGGCHYSLGCLGFKSNCSSCPRIPKSMEFFPKQNLISANKISQIPKFIAIAPSEWIASQAKVSTILEKQRIEFSTNTLDEFNSTDFIKPLVAGKANIKVGIASMVSNSYVKGGDLVMRLQEIIKEENASIELLFLNSDFSQEAPEENFWKKIDFLLVASRADNSPNVVHEAKSFGIPIMSSDVGGIPELLDEEFDVVIPISQISPEKLFERINQWEPTLRFDQVGMQKDFRRLSDASLERHIEIYRSLMS